MSKKEKDKTNPILFLEKSIDIDSEEKQALKGFNPKYHNFVDYIIKITHEIWEEKGIGVIYDTYAEDIVLHVAASTFRGVNGVISSTLATQNALPDRRNFGEEVIWSKAPNGRYLSSHRLGSTATHLGNHEIYGPPTGKKIFYRIIADCLVYNNKIEEEWLVRDNYFLLQQLGLDPIELAKKSTLYRQHMAIKHNAQGVENRTGQLPVPKKEFTENNSGALIGNLFHKALNYRYFNLIRDYYHENAVLHSICNQDYQGIPQIRNFYVSLFAAIPHANLVIDRITCNTGSDQDKVAIRWWLKGVHLNEGMFGPPSGKEVSLMGISHFLVSDGKIQEEWVVFDLFDVLCQIYADEVESTETTGEKKLATIIEELGAIFYQKSKNNRAN